ncbi:hypothetical protein AQZ52_01375 [Novosphingobium fuchskuhlense]|uniref:DUF2793 domain-containing protein n=1 Tax=Novosphingobium fuchskuhlense TaxID=1117702 RepID=A0A117UZC8_9SPHN|nr:DUF2793 domain-containing protein [Novosphingobium fuchskuhlense]KUR73649.1 hypothetical protein AQZ52_01375 [Novosphingobium fuchskuhlense]
MTDPISFSSASPRFALPLLFAGQSQKETTVNEALLAADFLMHPAVEAVVATPPTAPGNGQCWLVGSSPTGAFSGQSDRIAAWSEGGWRFIAPREGMRAYDVTAAAYRHYAGGSWHLIAAPAGPSGGSVIDSQARSAIAAILAALRSTGALS